MNLYILLVSIYSLLAIPPMVRTMPIYTYTPWTMRQTRPHGTTAAAAPPCPIADGTSLGCLNPVVPQYPSADGCQSIGKRTYIDNANPHLKDVNITTCLPLYGGGSAVCEYFVHVYIVL